MYNKNIKFWHFLKKNVKQNIQKKLLYIQNIANPKNEPDICYEKFSK